MILAAIGVIACWPHYISAATTADVTITATGLISGPSGFTATRITDTQIHLEWTNPPDAVNTMIRVGFGDYPDSPAAGYPVYYGDGESVDDLGINLDATGEAFYSAFTEYDYGFSNVYATGYVEGAGMLAISAAIADIGSSSVILILLIALNALAFWQRHIFLYLLMVGADIAFGLTYASENTLYSPAWIIGVAVCILGFFCLFRAVMKLFKHEEG